MMNTLAIITNKMILNHMIKKNERYERIVEQSQKLDKYINIAMMKRMRRTQRQGKVLKLPIQE